MDNSFIRQDRKVFSIIGWGFFALIALSSVLQLTAGWFGGRFLPVVLTQSDWYVWLITYIPMYGLGVPLAALITTRQPRVYIHDSPMGFGRLFACFAVSYAVLIAGNLIGTGITLVTSLFKGSGLTNPVAELITGGNIWITGLFVVLLAPPIEELLCRKLVIDRLAPFGDAAAIFVSALVFGLMHGNFSQFFYAFGIGLVFGYVYIRTGRLRYTIVMHMIINLLGSVIPLLLLDAVDLDALLNIGDDLAGFMDMLPGLGAYLAYSAVLQGLLVSGIVLFFVRRKRICLNPGEYSLRGRRFRTVALNSGMIAFFISSLALFVMNTVFM